MKKRSAAIRAGAQALKRGFQRQFTLDRRALAAFRICFGLLVLADLLRRWSHIDALYTDAGLLSRDFLAQHPQMPYQWSVFQLVGTDVAARVAFALIALVALTYVIGLWTRLAQVLLLVAVTSLNGRNLFAETGGSIVMNLAAAWTVFLPLGERYSLDARFGRSRPSSRRQGVFSVATIGLLLQIAVIYGFNALHKLRGAWLSGDAVHYVLWQNRVATQLAVWLREREPGFLSPLLSFTTVVTEAAIAVLVLLWWQRSKARTLAFVLGVLLHVGIALLMRLGSFQYAMMTLLVLILPRATWDFIEQRPWWPHHRDRALRARERITPVLASHLRAIFDRSSVAKSSKYSKYSCGFTRSSPPNLTHIWARSSELILSRTLRAPANTSVGRGLHGLREVAAILLGMACVSRLASDDPLLAKLGYEEPKVFDAITASLRLRQRWTMYDWVPRHDGIVVPIVYTARRQALDPISGHAPQLRLSHPTPHGELMTHLLIHYAAPHGQPYLPELMRYLMAWSPANEPRPGHREGAPDHAVAGEVWYVARESPNPGSKIPGSQQQWLLLRTGDSLGERARSDSSVRH